MRRKIIIITPVRNEEWILEVFLRACEAFADEVIIADQCSIDRSQEIAERSPKTHLIHNKSAQYSETNRTKLLISTARERHGPDAVLVALDADEIPLNTPAALEEWEHIRTLAPRTNINFSKPDLVTNGKIVGLQTDWRLGYVDDGEEHSASEIHAQRVPSPEDAPIYQSNTIVFLHVNLIRQRALRAKRRMYCALENVRELNPLWRRLLSYDAQKCFAPVEQLEPLNPEWRAQLLKVGMDVDNIRDEPPFWQDYEVLNLFGEHGAERFHWDEVWDTDWDRIAESARAEGMLKENTLNTIPYPPKYVHAGRTILKKYYKTLASLKRSVFDKR